MEITFSPIFPAVILVLGLILYFKAGGAAGRVVGLIMSLLGGLILAGMLWLMSRS